MDTRNLFDGLAHQEQPPMSVRVDQAIAAGRAIRRRRRVGAAAISALSVCLAATVTWLALPQPGQRDGVAVAVPTGAVPTGASAVAETEPSGAGFKKLKEKYPPVGKIASMPEIPIWMWLGRRSTAGPEGVVLCNAWISNGATCAGFPPLNAKEFARTQGSTSGILDAKQVRALHPDATAEQLRRLIDEQERVNALGKIFFGIARTEVHGIMAVTMDGRKITGSVARSVGAGFGVWAVKFPSDVTTAALVFTDANGKTLQRIRHG
ncbi:hypothetical protein [Streptosporangium roseum]|uniref:Uncharacterized protein n=1 Tax=Streptosporangium roseum (strain ATCC 12428 / DSM 43021 / JCM 3005 / KCTC 9067 / NCIMB 10171 / NRRL 2505 / NI 9100) TaxID=479432 RepID=D2AR99_STRRD|nr:hypothetical protein [Streptosporangium roseum]ACZ88440.1 hypothetical protein Sros_5692 [Streptosporangium roseum DSM 43021]